MEGKVVEVIFHGEMKIVERMVMFTLEFMRPQID